MLKLYSHDISGNAYKVRLMLSLLGLPHEVVAVDLMKGEHKQAEFLSLNPAGQIPVLVDGDTVLADAQAILVYLARQYGGDQWLPIEAEALARVVRWLSITAGEIRQGPESARLHHLLKMKSINIERANQKAAHIMALVEQHLTDHEWLALERPTIADVAAFPYLALSPDGQIALQDYPHIMSWIDRVKRLPGFVGMRHIPALDD